VNLKAVPVHVRAHIALFWVGMVAAGLGVVGFFLSYSEVGAPALAAIDVHREIPVLAYGSIAAWVVGLALMWYSRRRIDAAVSARLKESCDAIFTDDALDGRDA